MRALKIHRNKKKYSVFEADQKNTKLQGELRKMDTDFESELKVIIINKSLLKNLQRNGRQLSTI